MENEILKFQKQVGNQKNARHWGSDGQSEFGKEKGPSFETAK